MKPQKLHLIPKFLKHEHALQRTAYCFSFKKLLENLLLESFASQKETLLSSEAISVVSYAFQFSFM